MKKLHKLLTFLKSSGLKEEYSSLLKISAPIMEGGMFGLDGDEVIQKKKYYDEGYDRDVDDAAWHTPDDWYDSVSFLGDDMILITYNQDKQDSDFYRKLKGLFSRYGTRISEDQNYSFKDISGLTWENTTDIGNFLNEFPNLKKPIIEVVKSNKNIASDEEAEEYLGSVILVLADEEGVGNVKKSPYYLGHDFGHIIMDVEGDTDFLIGLEDILNYIGSLYVKEEDSEEEYSEEDSEENSQESKVLSDALDEQISGNVPAGFHYMISEIFPYQNDNEEDRYPDVFANFLSGNFHYEIPNYIDDRNGETYRISESDKALAEEALDKYIEENKELFSKAGETPLSGYAGSAIML